MVEPSARRCEILRVFRMGEYARGQYSLHLQDLSPFYVTCQFTPLLNLHPFIFVVMFFSCVIYIYLWAG